MNDPALVQAAEAAVSFLLALVWGIIARASWRFYLTRRGRNRLSRLLAVAASTVLLVTTAELLKNVIGAELADHWTGTFLFLVGNTAFLLLFAVLHHIVRLFPLRADPPGRRWLALNYGAGIAVALIVCAPVIAAGKVVAEPAALVLLRNSYLFVFLVLSARFVASTARSGKWRPGVAAAVMRHADLVVFAGAGILAGGAVLSQVTRGLARQPSLRTVLLHLALGALLTAPMAVRMLGEIVRGVLLAVASLATVAGLYFGGRALVHAADPGLASFVEFLTIGSIAFVLLSGQRWLREGVDRLVLRRSRRRRVELLDFVQKLSPAPGAEKCCRAALTELIRILRLSGAALLLDDETILACGDLPGEPLGEIWFRGPPRVTVDRPLGGFELRELPPALAEALSDAGVVAVVPVVSPRRRWGNLFLHAGFLGAALGDDDLEAIDAFAAQLALLLDATELLARTVEVERSLAHAEKLAAIGELSARVAHEIRNPVTAAKSLAEQLAREPSSPFQEEHRLILEELARIERQVAALLRFARRDEPQLAPLDLAELARSAVEGMRAKLEAAGIGVSLDLDGPLPARGDGEKLRQVLLNLIENAADALANGSERKRIEVILRRAGAAAELRVDDSGPGVADDALPRLFEPFYSRKAHGTGLGLAIAQRIVAAHGGSIEAANAPGGGMSMRIRLPLAGAAAEGEPR